MRGVLFRGLTRDCFVTHDDASLILRELEHVSFDERDSAACAAHAIARGLEQGEVDALASDEAAAVQAVLLRLATARPLAESLTTLHDALALDYGELG